MKAGGGRLLEQDISPLPLAYIDAVRGSDGIEARNNRGKRRKIMADQVFVKCFKMWIRVTIVCGTKDGRWECSTVAETWSSNKS